MLKNQVDYWGKLNPSQTRWLKRFNRSNSTPFKRDPLDTDYISLNQNPTTKEFSCVILLDDFLKKTQNVLMFR